MKRTRRRAAGLATPDLGARTVRTPRAIRLLLAVIGLYLLFPLGDIPLIGVSLSAPLFAVLFLEMSRRGVRWALAVHGPLIRRAACFAGALLLSWFANLAMDARALTAFELGLGLRLPYWVVCMVLVAVVVARTRDPAFYLRVLGWGIMAIGVLRLGSAVIAGMWRVGSALSLTQNEYGLLFSTFWPFALVLATMERGYSFFSKIGLTALILAIVVNGSRGSWVTVFITSTVYFLATWGLFQQSRKRIRATLWLFVLGVTTAGGLKLLLSEDLAARYLERARTFRSLEADTSYQVRVAMRYKALALFRRSPLLGVGPGQFTRTATEFDVPERLKGRSLEDLNRRSSHSAYFQLLAETGLLGSFLFGALVAWLTLAGLRTTSRLARAGLSWPIGYYLGFLGMSVHLIIIAGLLGTLPWFMYGLIGGMVAWERLSARRLAVTNFGRSSLRSWQEPA